MKKTNGRGEILRSLLGLNIKRFRVDSGFTKEELAENAGISVPYLGAIERGEKWPSPATFEGIAVGLGIEPCDLIRPENASAQEVKKITVKLIKDITALVNRSVKMMNTIVKESHKSDK